MDAVSWSFFQEKSQELACFGKKRLDGQLAYLATIRFDGLPRAHPVIPIIDEDYCFIFVEANSQKLRDLQDNGYFCLHCAVNDSSGSSGEFQMTGSALQIMDSSLRNLAEEASSYRPSSRSLLFELRLMEALSTTYRGGRALRSRWLQNT